MGFTSKIKVRDGTNILVLQYNDEESPSHVYRRPLNFNDDGSRWSLFAAVESKEKFGPFVQRGLDINFLPESLYIEGATVNNIDDYITIVGRAAVNWSVNNFFASNELQGLSSGTQFLLALELGYALNTPDKMTVNTVLKGDTGGIGGQISFNFVNLLAAHEIAFVFAHSGARWLISPGIRPNTDLYEIRYQWKINYKNKLEARIRFREDAERVMGAEKKRDDTDFFLRYTFKI